MRGLFRRRPEPEPGFDPAPGEAAYRRLLELARDLRESVAALAAATTRVRMREERLRRSVEEYDRIAREAIAAGRDIQAESAIASGEAAQAALDAVGPELAEVDAQRAELEAAIARLDAEARDLRSRLDAAATARAVSGARARLQETAAALHGHRGTLADVVAAAEDEAVRLEARARALAELHGQTSGENAK